IVRPIHTVHEKGQQMVVYPVVHWPVMFDLMRAIERGDTEQATIPLLAEAERRACEQLLDIYAATLTMSTAEEHARAPIHQLFWHRLAGERLKSFYMGKQGLQVGDTPISFEQLRTYDWQINGRRQPQTL